MDEATAPEPGNDLELPSSVRRINLPGKEIFLVGTAHVSQRSVEDVRAAIEAVRPDTVCVELDESRYRNLVDSDRWKRTDIIRVIRRGQAPLLLSSLIMTAFQKRIGAKLGIRPGAELLEAVKSAEAIGAEVVLADRDIQTTLRRTWRNLGLGGRLRLLLYLTASIFVDEDISEETIEQLKEEAQLTDVLQMMAREFPSLKVPLIDERDRYLAEMIRTAPGRTIVAVVGAGHVPGILKSIEHPQELGPLSTTPPPAFWGAFLKWAIPLLIVAIFVYGFVTGGREQTIESIWIWFLINGTLSAFGAALALGHPVTIATAFLAAPLTSLNPMLAAGWVSGLVQALVKKPTVEDLERLPEDVTTARGFWRNPVSRILLVVVLSNLGSVLGTFIAGSWIAARVLGLSAL